MTTTSTREELSQALQTYLNNLVSAEFVAAESFAVEIAREREIAINLVAPKYLVFYFDIEDILEPIKMISAYKGKNVTSQDKAPVPRLEDVSITDDEEAILSRLLKKAASKVYSTIAPYGKDIIGGFLYDQGVEPIDYEDDRVYNQGELFYVNDQLYMALYDETPAGTDPTDLDWFLAVGEEYNTYQRIVFTLNYNANMDPSMIKILDENLEDCLIKAVLLSWYKTINEGQMLPIADQEYEDAVSEVNKALWYRKTPTRRRTELL